MNEPTADINHSIGELLGAVSGAEAGIFDANDLPMIVWLRGDESYASDFAMDAESAMKILGIKRSRLTQISGKELRVGRIRVDRYIRPVYRQEDLDSYLEWTRPTATHIKSSDVLLQAATELRSGSREITDQITDQLLKNQELLTQNQNAVASETYRIQREAIKQQQERFESNRIETEQQLTVLSELLGGRFGGLELGLKELQQQLQDSSAAEAVSLEQSNGQLAESIACAHVELSKSVQANSDALAILKSGFESLNLSQQESFEMQFENFAAMRDTMDQQARFHRGVAEALAKIIEVQRELLQIRNLALRQNEPGRKLAIKGGRASYGRANRSLLRRTRST